MVAWLKVLGDVAYVGGGGGAELMSRCLMLTMSISQIRPCVGRAFLCAHVIFMLTWFLTDCCSSYHKSQWYCFKTVMM